MKKNGSSGETGVYGTGMKQGGNQRIRRVGGLAAVVIAAELVLWWGIRDTGMTITVDSLWYLSTAVHLTETFEFRLSTSMPFVSADRFHLVYWPPAFPFLLALVMKPGLSALAAARFITHLFLAATITLVYANLRIRGAGESIALAFSACYGWSYGVLICHAVVWSEQLFMLFMFGLFLSVHLAADRMNTRWIWTAAMLAGAAAMTRYVGVVLLLPMLYSDWSMHRGKDRWYWLSLIRAGLTVVPLGLWLARNHRLSGFMFGVRDSAAAAKVGNTMLESLETMYRTFLPIKYHTPVNAWICPVIALALIATLVVSIVRKPLRACRLPGLLASTAVAYLAVIYLSKVRYEMDPVHSRFLLPLYGMLIIGAGTRFVVLPAGGCWRRLGIGAGWSLAAMGVFSTLNSPLPPKPIYYTTTAELAGSDLLTSARDLAPNDPLLSNRPDYVTMGLSRPVTGFPLGEESARFIQLLNSGGFDGYCVVVFQESMSFDHLVSGRVYREWAREQPRVRKIYEGPGGWLYHIGSR
ncbi:glycosyltransferase family 39 protein [bacterium]|nr:glycosyltransferase family 39 protein [candidate division CSSED10-310 bacterium]